MSIQRVLAGVCLVAGVWVLAGPGWALLLAGAVLFLAPEPQRIKNAATRMGLAVAEAWRWVVTSRQTAAAASMPAAIAAIAVGLALAVGIGWGVAAAGLAIGGLALRVDGIE